MLLHFIKNKKIKKQAIAWAWSLSLKLKVATWDGKKCFPYTHANETEEFNCKMNVVLENLKTNMRMNASSLWINDFFVH
jgi:hypothetical protein